MSDKWRRRAMTVKTNVNKTTTDGSNKHAHTYNSIHTPTHTYELAGIIRTYLHIKANCWNDSLGRGRKESLQSQQARTQRRRWMKGALKCNNNKRNTHTHTHAIYFCNCNHWQYTDIFCHFAILQAAFKLSIFLRMNIHLLFCYFDRSTLYVQLVRLSVDNVCTITCNYIILLLIADIRDSSFFHICAYPTYIVAYSYVYICQ